MGRCNFAVSSRVKTDGAPMETMKPTNMTEYPVIKGRWVQVRATQWPGGCRACRPTKRGERCVKYGTEHTLSTQACITDRSTPYQNRRHLPLQAHAAQLHADRSAESPRGWRLRRRSSGRHWCRQNGRYGPPTAPASRPRHKQQRSLLKRLRARPARGHLLGLELCTSACKRESSSACELRESRRSRGHGRAQPKASGQVLAALGY